MSFANARPIKASAAQKKRGRPCLPGRPLRPPVQPFGGTNRLQDFAPARSTKPKRLDADGLTTARSGQSSTEPLLNPPVPPDSCSAPPCLPFTCSVPAVARVHAQACSVPKVAIQAQRGGRAGTGLWLCPRSCLGLCNALGKAIAKAASKISYFFPAFEVTVWPDPYALQAWPINLPGPSLSLPKY